MGGGPLGGMEAAFGYDTPEHRAVETVHAALASPIRFLDTSAGYGDGASEHRIGTALQQSGGLARDMVLATKVDPDFVTGEFDGAAVRRSIEGSLERLGVERVDILHLHDPERITFEEAMAPGGAVEELVRIKEEGIADHLGVAGGPTSLLSRFLRTGAFEIVLTHNRWTLADRTADALIQQAHEAGYGIVNGAPFGGGVLARGSDAVSTYCYAPMRDETATAVRRIEQICADAGVPLGAAAVQFSTRDERIHSTIVGVSRPERIAQLLEWSSWTIPDDVWAAILDASGRDARLQN
ncbi:oxidoreductase [Demequina activiva]|uniref:Oxidoreductase n=2 Tax=Demequina activiva TaxID=1582364 RepID=A0A919Q605_9MICO|nr:oxidoreductase [Demequina activiva]